MGDMYDQVCVPQRKKEINAVGQSTKRYVFACIYLTELDITDEGLWSLP